MDSVQEFKETYLTHNPVDAIMLHAAYADAELSNDPRTKIGARLETLEILDKPLGGNIYGGFMGMNHVPEAYRDQEQAQQLHDKTFKHDNILHAEEYIIQNAKMTEGMHPYKLTELGLWVLDVPCDNCTETVLTEGIPRVVTHLPFVYQHVNETSNSLEAKMGRVEKMRANGVDFRFYPNPLTSVATIDGKQYVL